MSFDVYLVCFTEGQPSGVRRDLVRAAFGEHVSWDEPEYGRTQYSQQDACSILLSPLTSDPNLISGISVNRPVRDGRFWEAMYGIMRLGNVALFYPGGSGPLIAETCVAAHLPADILDSLGEPFLIHSGSDIIGRIESS